MARTKVVIRGYFLHPKDRDNPVAKPLDFAGGMRALAQVFGMTQAEMERHLMALGHAAKEKLAQMAREGEIPAVPPLSPYTYFRKKKFVGGEVADKFTYETGAYYKTLRVELIRGGKRKRGFAAVALLPRGRTARGLPHVRLLDIWNAGLTFAVYDKRSKQAMVAWLKANLPEVEPVVEEYVRAHPDQWMMFHPFWPESPDV